MSITSNELAIGTIYNESCLATMARMVDQGMDLVITSPPYNMRTRTRNGKYTKREQADHFSQKYDLAEFADALPIAEFYALHKSILTELLRVSPIICYNFQIVTGSKEAFFQLIGDFACYIKDIIIWDKGHGQPAMHSHILNSCYELVLILESNARVGRMIYNAKFARGTMENILRIKHARPIAREHSAGFPVALPIALINAFSNPGALVYDPFMGLGTTALACLHTGRNYLGSEISTKYVMLAEERIAQEKFNLSRLALDLWS